MHSLFVWIAPYPHIIIVDGILTSIGAQLILFHDKICLLLGKEMKLLFFKKSSIDLYYNVLCLVIIFLWYWYIVLELCEIIVIIFGYFIQCLC